MTDAGALPELSRLGIGKVLEELHGEFPTLTISKIRFLESEGLVEPGAHARRATASSRSPTSSGCGSSCASRPPRTSGR